MSKKLIGIRLSDYIDSDTLTGSIDNIINKLTVFKDKYSELYEDVQICSDYDYDNCLEYHLEGMRLETDEEYEARLDEESADEARNRQWKLEQFNRLKKELGEE